MRIRWRSGCGSRQRCRGGRGFEGGTSPVRAILRFDQLIPINYRIFAVEFVIGASGSHLSGI